MSLLQENPLGFFTSVTELLDFFTTDLWFCWFLSPLIHHRFHSSCFSTSFLILLWAMPGLTLQTICLLFTFRSSYLRVICETFDLCFCYLLLSFRLFNCYCKCYWYQRVLLSGDFQLQGIFLHSFSRFSVCIASSASKTESFMLWFITQF